MKIRNISMFSACFKKTSRVSRKESVTEGKIPPSFNPWLRASDNFCRVLSPIRINFNILFNNVNKNFYWKINALLMRNFSIEEGFLAIFRPKLGFLDLARSIFLQNQLFWYQNDRLFKPVLIKLNSKPYDLLFILITPKNVIFKKETFRQ